MLVVILLIYSKLKLEDNCLYCFWVLPLLDEVKLKVGRLLIPCLPCSQVCRMVIASSQLSFQVAPPHIRTENRRSVLGASGSHFYFHSRKLLSSYYSLVLDICMKQLEYTPQANIYW